MKIPTRRFEFDGSWNMTEYSSHGFFLTLNDPFNAEKEVVVGGTGTGTGAG